VTRARREFPRLSIPEFTAPPAVDSALDWLFFIVGGLGSVWLAYLLAEQSFTLGWWGIALAVVFWVALAYLALPRLHRILTRIYVPDYFIGRARTSDGLLGDPVNLALLGSEAAVHEAMTRAGWTRADDLSLLTGWRIVASTLARRSYLEAPVSPLLLFGRKQDFAYQQEVDGSPGKRHHVRFWRCPPGWLLPGGRRVEWLAAGTYDRRVGLSLFTLQVTHKIDANTDEERDHIVSTVRGSSPEVGLDVIRDFSSGYHARNGGGDAIVTDGDLPILDVGPLVPGPDAEQVVTDSRDRRPAPTIVGSALLALGGASTLVESGVAMSSWDALLAEVVGEAGAQLGSAEYVAVQVIVAALLVVPAVFGVIQLLIAWSVFRGSNAARVIAMTVTALGLLLEVLSLELGGPRITVTTSLVPVALGILLLLALSSERALVYARRDRKAPKRIASRPGGVAPF
jgi:hypothetical protein